MSHSPTKEVALKKISSTCADSKISTISTSISWLILSFWNGIRASYWLSACISINVGFVQILVVSGLDIIIYKQACPPQRHTSSNLSDTERLTRYDRAFKMTSFAHTRYFSQAPQAVHVETIYVMWKKFSTWQMWRTICHVEKFLHMWNMEKICSVAIYVLLHGGKIEPNIVFVKKNDKFQLWFFFLSEWILVPARVSFGCCQGGFWSDTGWRPPPLSPPPPVLHLCIHASIVIFMVHPPQHCHLRVASTSALSSSFALAGIQASWIYLSSFFGNSQKC